MNPSAQNEWHRLFNAALNDQISAIDKLELAALLKSSSEARQLWFLYHDNECTLAEMKHPAELKTRIPGRSWIFWRPLTAAAVGLALGMFCTSIVFAYAKPKLPEVGTKQLPLADAGYESGSQVPARGIPSRAGAWSGDFSRVGMAENGIVPKHGQHMLRFLRSDNELSAQEERSYVGSVAQVIDLRPLREEIVGSETVVELSAWFDSMPQAQGEKYEFAVKAAAFRGEMAEAPRLWADQDSSLSRSERFTIADGDPSTWQRVSVPLAVPEDTDFLVIECAVARKLPLVRQGAIEFPGQFVDEIKLELRTRPTTPDKL